MILPGDPRIRRSGIGGSDIAKIAGISKFGGAMDVWLEKIGQSAPLIETERMYWGTRLEDVVAKEYARRSGNKVRQAPTTTDPVTGLRARVIRYSEDRPWRMANVDRLTSIPKRGFEAKTADNFAAADFGEEGSDQVPPDYLLQCMWYMGVTRYEVWDLAVLIGGNHFRTYTIERDNALIASLFEIGDDFWLNNVVPKVPPPIDGSEGARRFLEAGLLHPDESVPMSDRLYELALEYATVTREMKDLDARKDALGNGIREQMQGHGKAARDNAKVTWSLGKVRRLDTSALVEAHPDVVAPFYVESAQPRLTVTVKEEK
jgi:putative phage-type endonuclease